MCSSDLQWWPIKPGTDTALMLALLQEMITSNTHDLAFLQRHCTGFEELRRHLAGDQDGIVKNADWAAGITGLSADPRRPVSGAWQAAGRPDVNYLLLAEKS